jgi:hypothetical protein
MPCRWLLGGFEGWVEHVASLPRPSFLGQSDRQEGGAELPTMYVLWDANRPEGPRALENGELLNWSRKEGPAQSGSYFGACSSMYLYGTWGCIRASRGVQVFGTPPCSGRRRCPIRAAANPQGSGGQGTRWPGVTVGKLHRELEVKQWKCGFRPPETCLVKLFVTLGFLLNFPRTMAV